MEKSFSFFNCNFSWRCILAYVHMNRMNNKHFYVCKYLIVEILLNIGNTWNVNINNKSACWNVEDKSNELRISRIMSLNVVTLERSHSYNLLFLFSYLSPLNTVSVLWMYNVKQHKPKWNRNKLENYSNDRTKSRQCEHKQIHHSCTFIYVHIFERLTDKNISQCRNQWISFAWNSYAILSLCDT